MQTVQQDPVQVNVNQRQHNSKHGEIIPAKDEICHKTIATFEEIEGGEICSNFRVELRARYLSLRQQGGTNF